jgi:hypothetical protein
MNVARRAGSIGIFRIGRKIWIFFNIKMTIIQQLANCNFNTVYRFKNGGYEIKNVILTLTDIQSLPSPSRYIDIEVQ